ncbi:hypothetical protein L207DRAFT_642096 [Hyaloscypha variabilis F]|uniref:Peptidase S8/S53 domain-containing protein n=1 Tax=Hyaloscypha variabilis (strain UAMH 11265 / GT02V1 / F) TaxID=1149755 RepID=A0A2J6QRC1_HYAVF|nr:hypothetical protein L207DRAFT_642849 [Hyaloscypha variabilis F]PMD30010.1 hypothetical protein L207DRAFT_642096 [Hyaloscypha variabilis F]
MTSTLDDEPEVVDTPHRDKELEAQDTDLEPSSDEDDEEEVSIKKRFEEIIRDLKSGTIDLRTEAVLKEFAIDNASYLDQKTTGDGDHNTLLHMLVEEAKDKVFDTYQRLVGLLLARYPQLLGEKDSNEKTPLYIAISKKRDKLVRFMCDAHPKIDTVLSIACYHSENCLHVAIRRNVSPKLAIFLIEKAGEGTLCAKDDKGNTPLNLAVDYDRATEAQLEIVEALVLQCDKAMDERTNAPNYFSPYRYHEYTRAEAKKVKEVESKKALKDEKDIAPGRTEDLSSTGREERSSAKAKSTRQNNDPKVAPLMPMPKVPNMPIPPGTEQRSNSSIRRVNTGDRGIAESANKHSKPGEMALNIPPNTSRSGVSDGSRTPTTTKPRAKKRAKEEAKVTEESADAILSYLKLHCMRTRNHDDAVDFLYGREQDKQIFFDLYDTSTLTISEERIEEGLAHLKFEDVLQYVALPRLKLERRPVLSKKKSQNPDGKGRNDMIFLFNFLRNKSVKRVIRVIVDDTLEPSHSDEAIETALGGLKVEIWDWKKIDLCTETIVTAAPDAREVCLYWSGNNAVLRSWSEPGGLPQLKKLEKVHLHVGKGLETGKRTRNNIREFQRRLKILRPEVVVDIVEEHEPVKHDSTGGPVDTAREQVEHRHKWLTCMDEFADFIQNVELPLPLREEITIALIDDGVDINEQSLHAKIIGGRSFCQRDKFQNLSKPYYVTSGGHGTVMASLICRVCPKAQLYVVKLDEYMSENMKRQITAQSAAKAVRAAIDRKVHIISMSWTIERTAHNTADIGELESAIEAAARAGILMFCAANDQGIARDQSFPAACGGTKHLFKIGAAEASGAVWKWVGDPADVDFIFPGHNVVKDRPNDAPLEKCKTLTGSSVATAIAAGLAALVLYCVQLGALNVQGQGGNSVTLEDFRSIKGHERMKEAFLAIGTSQASGNKYIEVWDVFGPAAKKAERVGREGRIEIVTEVAGRLKTRRTFE